MNLDHNDNTPVWQYPVYDAGVDPKGIELFLKKLIIKSVFEKNMRLCVSRTQTPVLFIKDDEGEAGITLRLSSLPPLGLRLARAPRYTPDYSEVNRPLKTIHGDGFEFLQWCEDCKITPSQTQIETFEDMYNEYLNSRFYN